MCIGMEIGIEIEDKTGQLEFEIFEDLYVDQREIEIKDAIIARYISTIDGTIEFVVVLPENFGMSVVKDVSSWLCNKLERKDIVSLRIENEVINLKLEDIEKRIESVIKA